MKTLAGLVLGAAAAYGAYKYFTMTEEEKQQLNASLKKKAAKLKAQAASAEEQAMNYFNDLKEQGTNAYNKYAPKAEEYLRRSFAGSKSSGNGETSFS